MKTQVTLRPDDSILTEPSLFLSAAESALLTQKPVSQQPDSLAGRYVLKTFFRDSQQLKVLLPEIEVLYKKKCPYITYNNEIWLASVSHSDECVAVSFAKDAQPGIDIEKLTPRNQHLRDFVMNDSERPLVTNVEHDTTLMWTMKEAAFKADPCQVTLSDYKLTKRLNNYEYVIQNTQTSTRFTIITKFIDNYVVSYTLYSS